VSPAPEHTRSWFSYSLRSLFGLVTLTAIGLGWVANERRQSRREMEIVEQLETRVAGVSFVGQFDRSPYNDQSSWRRALSALCGPRVDSLDFLGDDSFSDISMLSELRSLWQLSVMHTHVSNLQPLARLKSLESLFLCNTPVSDLAPLTGLANLNSLHLWNTQVSDLLPLSRLMSAENLGLA
jgi:hypothetical protein